jgi:hypothetical protein
MIILIKMKMIMKLNKAIKYHNFRESSKNKKLQLV